MPGPHDSPDVSGSAHIIIPGSLKMSEHDFELGFSVRVSLKDGSPEASACIDMRGLVLVRGLVQYPLDSIYQR